MAAAQSSSAATTAASPAMITATVAVTPGLRERDCGTARSLHCDLRPAGDAADVRRMVERAPPADT